MGVGGALYTARSLEEQDGAFMTGTLSSDHLAERIEINVQKAGTLRGPLVSCLMVSRGHVLPAAFAIQCYRRQSYAHRELVVVTANPDSQLREFIAQLGDPTIRFFEVDSQPLGSLRNAAIAEAAGDLICHWDDDDLSHPHRLACQIAGMMQIESEACFLERVLLWWPARRCLRLSSVRRWEGSMVVRRDALSPYPPLEREEDTAVVDILAKERKVALVDMPDAYCYVAHGHNTSGEEHLEKLLHRSIPLPGNPTYAAALSQLSSVYPLRAYVRFLARKSKASVPRTATEPARSRLVSLGYHCQAAHQIQRLDRAPTPAQFFDWLITPHDALIRMLAGRFSGFLGKHNLTIDGEADGHHIVTDRAFGVEIRHDFPSSASIADSLGSVQSKYTMLANRFFDLARRPGLIFVRQVAPEDFREDHARELQQALGSLFGDRFRLVFVSDVRSVPQWQIPSVLVRSVAQPQPYMWQGSNGAWDDLFRELGVRDFTDLSH